MLYIFASVLQEYPTDYPVNCPQIEQNQVPFVKVKVFDREHVEVTVLEPFY